MKKYLFALLLAQLFVLHAGLAQTVKSPDGTLEAEFSLTADGEPRYLVRKAGQVVLGNSRLGLVRDDADFAKALTSIGESKIEPVSDRYEILTAKRRLNDYRANRRVFHLATKDGKKMDVVFQVSNDGVAFRYFFPGESTTLHRIKEEISSFHFQAGTKAWLQPMQVAKTGYESSNPAYEEFYVQDIPVGTVSPLKAGWIFPALFRTGDTWLLVSEGSLPRTYCASHLSHESPDGEYTIAFPDARETMGNQPVNPVSQLPWSTPWRFIAIGTLKTIAESTLGIDLADKPTGPVDLTIKPGKAAWSWALLGDGSANFETQKQFIDYAAEMRWAYCLIDAWWDKQIGYEKMKELADYAKSKNVGILLWYNSAGDWNTVHQTPRDKLVTHESRVQEFGRLQAMGIKGLKVDFFGGDGQPVIAYYHDMLEDAAPYGLLMNFHGATLPRGWQRTYPHLMTVEAIRGEEFITFGQDTADRQPTHASMLPFTRNVFDPMDFTPMVLDRINNKIVRRTTSAFELALSVIFTSGIQHYAEIPAGMAKVPPYVREFLKQVPSVWDDTKFIDGFPGKFAVLARKGDGRWFIAGINGEAVERRLTLNLDALTTGGGTLITDAGAQSFQQRTIAPGADRKIEVTLAPNGGFVLMLE